MPKDPEKDWIKKHIARLNIPTVPEIAPRDNTRVRKTGRAALAEAARLVSTGGRSIGPADPTNTDAPATTVQSQYRPRYDKAIKGAASFLPPVFGFEGGKETAHQVNAGNYAGAAATAALTLLAPEDVGAVTRKLTGKALPKIARAAIKLEDGSVHWGRSHAAAIDAAIRDGALPRRGASALLERATDGFVDAKGNFLTRAETADRIRALGVKLPKDMRDGNFTSEELLGIPSIRRKAMVEPGSLPHQGMRSFDESFPSVGEVQVRAKGARTGKPTPAAVADSVLSFARPTLTDFNSLDDYRAALARERANLAGAGLAPSRAAGSLGTATTDGIADAQRILRTFQHNSGAPNMPRIKAVDKEKAAHMAKIYEALPKNDPKAREAYDALNKEVEQQYQAIIDNGHKIEFVDSDPYKSSKEMMEDVRTNRRLKVFKTPADNFHPYMTPEQNDKFRAVHDWLAHAGEGHQFGPIGEENAYRVHSSTLSPLARRALATETRGQNSWVNFGPNAHLPVRERPFAEQKAALWPEEFIGDYPDMTIPAPFYSRLERAIQGGQNKATPAQWLAQLSKNVNSDERLFTGVDAFLKGADPKTPISRDDVLGVFNKGKINLNRKTLADPTVNTKSKYALPEVLTAAQHAGANPGELELQIANDGAAYRALTREFPELADDEDWAAKVVQDVWGTDTKPTKFEEHTLPGGTNYRENLTTLEHDASPAVPFNEWLLLEGYTPWEMQDEESMRKARAGYDRVVAKGGARAAPPFHSNHFPDINLLLHTRTKDRALPKYTPEQIADIAQRIRQATGARDVSHLASGAPSTAVRKGLITPEEAQAWGASRFPNSPDFQPPAERVLHAEEIQSDWHQKGRENGYASDPHTHLPPGYQLRQNGEFTHQVVDPNGYSVSVEGSAQEAIDRALERINNDPDRMRFGEGGRVPDAPFKKTDDWQLLGLKQLIDDAVRGGYDRIAWTPGDLQAKRYSLSNVVDEIFYHPEHGTFAASQNGRVVHSGVYDPQALPSVIGKEAAERLLASPRTGALADDAGVHALRGDDLSIGGEGMRQFYDRMLPKNLNKYWKQLGIPPAEIAPVDIGNPGGPTLTGFARPEPKPIPSFPVTPEMKLQVLLKGQPLLTLMGALGLGATGLAAAREKQQF